MFNIASLPLGCDNKLLIAPFRPLLLKGSRENIDILCTGICSIKRLVKYTQIKPYGDTLLYFVHLHLCMYSFIYLKVITYVNNNVLLIHHSLINMSDKLEEA